MSGFIICDSTFQPSPSEAERDRDHAQGRRQAAPDIVIDWQSVQSNESAVHGCFALSHQLPEGRAAQSGRAHSTPAQGHKLMMRQEIRFGFCPTICGSGVTLRHVCDVKAVLHTLAEVYGQDDW